jgi:excisionase family DNA binding protein
MQATTKNINPCLTMDEVVTRLNCSKRKVEQMVANGELVGFYIGKLWRMRPENLERWIEAREKQTA